MCVNKYKTEMRYCKTLLILSTNPDKYSLEYSDEESVIMRLQPLNEWLVLCLEENE
mgnify:CR=1 FL=1